MGYKSNVSTKSRSNWVACGGILIKDRIKDSGDPCPESAAVDVITNVCHFCHSVGIDVTDVMSRVNAHLDAELEDDDEG